MDQMPLIWLYKQVI